MEWSRILSEYRERRSTSMVVHDLRSEFEKDYHRIIGSASFRRLQDKTQVFPLDTSDFIRTRLTHSLEVSSFAKSLGQSVGARIIEEKLDPEFGIQQKEDISDILACAGLVHDIGNPPFGHFGEICIRQFFKENLDRMEFRGRSLRSWLNPQMQRDLEEYEGNAQALRVLTRLHFLIDEHGMNLTYGLLGSIIKYPTSSLEVSGGKVRDGHDSAYMSDAEGNIAGKKLGYFYGDRELFADIESRCGLNGHRSPLAFLLEAADDIAYKTADIEDAYKKGFLKYEELLEELSELPENAGRNGNPAHRILLDQFTQGLEKQPDNPYIYAIQNWTVRLQGYLLDVAAESFIRNYRRIMDGTWGHDLFYGTDAEQLMFLLGDIGWRYVFDSDFIYRQELRTAEIYEYLLKKFVKAALYYDTDEWETRRSPVDYKLMSLISGNYKRAYAYQSRGKDEGERLYLRLLLVTDSVSGMTDSHACGLYQDMRGIRA